MNFRNTLITLIWLAVSSTLLVRAILMVGVTIETELLAAKLYGTRYIAALIH